MRILVLSLLAACAPEAAIQGAGDDAFPDNAQLIGSDPLTSVVPHLVRGTTVDLQVRLNLSSVVGSAVRMGASTNAGGSPGLCPASLPSCLDLAAPAAVWSTGTVELDGNSDQVALSTGFVPAGAPVDLVDLQPVFHETSGFYLGQKITRGVYDRSEVCEIEIVAPDGTGAYIAYTDLNVVNPFVEGLLAWEIPTASLTVYVPSGADLILRDYDGGNVTQVINHDAGDAVIFDGAVFGDSIPVSCP